MSRTQGPLDQQWLEAELRRLAEIAAGILDGEEVARIICDEAMQFIANPVPQHRFLAGDHYDVDAGLFLRNQKLLMRIERLAAPPAVVNGALWVPVPGRGCVTVALHHGPHHRYYQFAMEQMPTPPEMAEVFATGRLVTAPPDPAGKLMAVLAPVRDSLGGVVAVCELTAPIDPAAPAWE